MSEDRKDSTFAEEVVKDILKPAYKQQLLRGISNQQFYHKAAHWAQIFTHIFLAANTFISGYSLYSDNNDYKTAVIACAVVSQLIHALSGLCTSEENTLLRVNTEITHNILSSIKSKDNDDVVVDVPADEGVVIGDAGNDEVSKNEIIVETKTGE